MTSIEWVLSEDGSQGKTWNPITGCTKISAGCKNCYAADIAKRFWGDRTFDQVQFHVERLDEPLKRRKPTMWFVNSMSDLFHESVTDEQLDQIFAVMALAPQHTYQVLTKRPDRMRKYCNNLILDILDRRIRFAATVARLGCNFSCQNDQYYKIIESLKNPSGKCFPIPNVWLGVTVENQKAADQRIPLLLETFASTRFLSVEPMLENVNLTRIDWSERTAFVDATTGKVAVPFTVLNHFRPLDWVICGGESGSKARPFHLEWARSLRDQCADAGVPFFFKQLGSNPYENGQPFKAKGKGNDLENIPEDLRIRQMPTTKQSLCLQ
jgi:protein gp37